MATIDNLEIQITAESDKAVSHLGKLQAVLEKIEAIGHKSGFDLVYRNLKKISSLSFSGVTSSMERMATASEKITRSSSRMEHFARSIRKVRAETAKAKDEFVRFSSASSFTGVTPFTGIIPYRRFNKTNNGGTTGTFGGNLPPIPPISVPLQNNAYTKRTSGLLGDGKTIFLDEDRWKENKFGEWLNRRKNGARNKWEALKWLRSDMKKTGAQAKQTSNSFTYLSKTIMRFAIYKLLNIAIKNISRGLQNIALYSKEANAVLTEYKTIGLQLGNSIASSLIPVLQKLLPLARLLVNAIIDVSNAVNILFAKMNGQTSFKKAKKYTDDYAKSLGKLRTMSSMDEIHTIGQTYNYSEMFEDTKIDSAGFADALATIGQITAALFLLKTLFSGKEWAATLTALTGKTIRYSSILKKVGGVLLTIVGALEIIRGVSDAWVNGLDWSNFAEILVGIGITVGGLALTFGGTAAAIGAVIGGVALLVVGFKDLLTNGVSLKNIIPILAGIAVICVAIGLAIGWLPALIALIVAAVAVAVVMIIKYWDEIKTFFVDLWKTIVNGCVAAINHIIEGFEAFVNFFVKGINLIIAGINKISFTIPDWVPGIGGKSVGFNIGYVSEVKFGRLQGYATGGFPEDGLFMANHSELVGQFSNGKTAVANNEQIVEGISRGVSEAMSDQNDLLREQNRLLTQLLAKDTTATISVSTITRALERQNRRNGKTVVPVGT